MMSALSLPASILLASTQIGAIDPSATPTETSANQDELIEAERERYERLTVPVLIEGQGPFRFMIDTGAQATAITRGMEVSLQLESAGQALVVGMAGSEVVDLFELDRLELGSRTIDNIQAPIFERRHVGADGIIGLDTLQDLRILLDFRAEAISITSIAEEIDRKGYDIIVRARRRDGQLLITSAEIDGIRTAVIIDTGAQGSLGNLALQRKLRARVAGTSIATDVLGNKIVGDVSIVRNMQIDGLKITNLAITYADTPAFDALGLSNRPALSLGMSHLRMFERVAIDFEKKRVLFDLPKGAGRRPLSELFKSPG